MKEGLLTSDDVPFIGPEVILLKFKFESEVDLAGVVGGIGDCDFDFAGCFRGKIDRVERVDTSFADIDYSKLHDIQIAGNSFHNIKAHVTNPVIKNHRQNSLDSTWRVNFDGALPFKGHARAVTSVVVTGTLKNGSNVTRYTSPSVQTSGGAKKDELVLRWDERVAGTVTVTARVDN